jgi:oligogalacturonide lyase
MKPARRAERGLQSASTNASRGIAGLDEIRPCAGRSGLKPALLAGIAALLAANSAAQDASAPAAKLRDEWIDSDTGHRVVRLSRIPGESESFYFHQNAFTAEGDKMVFTHTVTNRVRQLCVLDWKTRAITPLTDSFTNRGETVHAKTRQAFWLRAGTLYVTHLDTRATREIAQLPFGWQVSTVNADATLLAGAFVESGPKIDTSGPKSSWFNQVFEAKRPQQLFTVEIVTGKTNFIHRYEGWLGHIQFSPTDPTLLQFCHEGPWHLLDRIWHIRTDGRGLRLLHKRTMPMEIAGHEFWSPDGKTVWFDLQMPKGETFFLAGVEVETGKTTRYPIERDQWSVHFNISRDGKLFAGDGGAPNMVARARNGKWLYLFTPQANGTLKAEKLVNMGRHNYDLEPNVNFTPDAKWIVFRGNCDGSAQVYAVEVARARTN